MGLISFTKSFAKQLGSDIAGGLNLLSTTFQKPIQTATYALTGNAPKLVELVKTTTKQPAATQVKSTLLTTGIATAGLLAPAIVGKKIATAGAVVGAGALLAPRTTEAIVSNPQLSKTAAASIISPVAGVIVGSEQGASLIAGSITSNVDTIKKAATAAGLIAAGTAVAGTAALGTAKIIDIVKEKKEEVIKPVEEVITEEEVIKKETKKKKKKKKKKATKKKRKATKKKRKRKAKIKKVKKIYKKKKKKKKKKK